MNLPSTMRCAEASIGLRVPSMLAIHVYYPASKKSTLSMVNVLAKPVDATEYLASTDPSSLEIWY